MWTEGGRAEPWISQQMGTEGLVTRSAGCESTQLSKGSPPLLCLIEQKEPGLGAGLPLSPGQGHPSLLELRSFPSKARAAPARTK